MQNQAQDRIIFHCDCNNFYASCECLEHPELKDVPLAVAGDPANRTGIVVAKNEIAKRYGVRTTDTVWAARKKCPDIVFVPPHRKLYAEISARVNAVYRQYTDFVEPASIDESYLDMTSAMAAFSLSPADFADHLRAQIRSEIGITISVGVSFNKIFAKLGSDYKKPDATTVISRENYREILWPLPVSDMMYVGKSAAALLRKKCIFTIGDLARMRREDLTDILGKSGQQLWIYANGLDDEPVRRFGEHSEIKSVSRGMTFRRNLVNEAEVRAGLAPLVDEVSSTLRRNKLCGSVVQIQIKTPALRTISRQVSLDHPTALQREILRVALNLVHEHWRIGADNPIRALTVGVTHLVASDEVTEQLSLFDFEKDPANHLDRTRQENLESTLDALRKKHGNGVISMGVWASRDLGIYQPENED